jgi:hypothetical protein
MHTFPNFIILWYYANRNNMALRLFENRMLRRIFGLKRDEMTGLRK